jgi:hypothetical protein
VRRGALQAYTEHAFRLQVSNVIYCLSLCVVAERLSGRIATVRGWQISVQVDLTGRYVVQNGTESDLQPAWIALTYAYRTNDKRSDSYVVLLSSGELGADPPVRCEVTASTSRPSCRKRYRARFIAFAQSTRASFAALALCTFSSGIVIWCRTY